jgi:hypothetical protein
LLEVAAQNGNDIAAWALAMRYMKGDSLQQNDVLATRWLSVAAKNGHVAGMAWYGRALLHGIGIARNDEQGLNLLNAADQHGYPEAARFLGMTYAEHGRSFYDSAKALNFLKRAAAEGSTGAKADLAKLAAIGVVGATSSPPP